MTSILLVLLYLFFLCFLCALPVSVRSCVASGQWCWPKFSDSFTAILDRLSQVIGYQKVQKYMFMLTATVAIQFLLFSMYIPKWARLAGKTTISMFGAFIAAVVIVVGGFFLFRNFGIDRPWDVAGMMIGLYTGSPPNLASIKLALNADETQYMLIATCDLVVDAFHLLFVLTIAQRLFLTFLPAYRFIGLFNEQRAGFELDEPYWGLLKQRKIKPLLKAFVLAVAIFVIGGSSTYCSRNVANGGGHFINHYPRHRCLVYSCLNPHRAVV